MPESTANLLVRPYYGLENQGATCYLNSVLQILFMTPKIHDRLDQGTVDPENPVIDDKLKTLFGELKEKTCSTKEITETLGIKNVYEQRDAAVCLEEILHKVSPQVSEIFEGVMIKTKTCSEGHIIIKDETPSLILPLALKDANDKIYDVEHGFKEIFQEKSSRDAEVYCDDCKTKTKAKSTCQMEKCPDVLVLLLKRFDRDPWTRNCVKSDRCVEIPGLLEIKNKEYKLYGMVNHMGGLRGGHYTATILSEENQTWYEFNDSYVQQAEEQPFANNKPYSSRAAYLLMYRDGESSASFLKQLLIILNKTRNICKKPLSSMKKPLFFGGVFLVGALTVILIHKTPYLFMEQCHNCF